MHELMHFTPADSNEDILAAVEADGACILDDLLADECCDRLMADFMPHIDAAPWNNTEADDPDEGDDFFGRKTKRFHGLPALSGTSSEIVAHPRLLLLASSFIGSGEACRALHVSTTELMVLGEGQEPQMLHRDADSWRYLAPETRARLLFSANVALCDFTGTNGATVVAPGSHTWPSGRQAGEGEVCQAIMRKGSALLYRGDVLHGGGDNAEADLRTGFYVGYIPSWLSGLENHALSNGEALIATLDDNMKQLLNVAEPFVTFP